MEYRNCDSNGNKVKKLYESMRKSLNRYIYRFSLHKQPGY